MLQQRSALSFQPRERRRRVMLPARIRNKSGWSDACILNISSRGLLVYSAGAADPGSFVEIRRGGQLVIARVVWRENQRMGMCSPDPVPVDAIISNRALETAVELCGSESKVERRQSPRSADRSRARARAAEFLTIVLVGTAMAGAAAVYVQRALAKPLTAVSSALEPR